MKTGELKNIHYSKNIKNNILEMFYSMYLKKYKSRGETFCFKILS